MKQRITQAKIQHLLQKLQDLMFAINDARVRYANHGKFSSKKLVGYVRFLKALQSLPTSSDYSMFEVQLKRRLVRTNHRIFGKALENGGREGSLRDQLPLVYSDLVDGYIEASRQMLVALSDVDIRNNHQQLKTVEQIIEQAR